MSVVKAIRKEYKKAKERGWDKIYWFIDIHDTILKPLYTAKRGEIPKEWTNRLAKPVLQMLSERDDVCMILYTCSHPPEIEQYIEFFKENGIHFEYINKNEEVFDDPNNPELGSYKDKPYMNVLLDDKAGFDPDTDWESIFYYFENIHQTIMD